MTTQPTILALSGSLRNHAYTKRVLRIASHAVEKAGASLTVVDLKDYPMTIYDPDDHEENGFDQYALELQNLFVESDGFLIASPEHNGSIPAALKNALDWASRPGGNYDRQRVFRNKTAAIMSASPGQLGGVRSLSHLRDIFTSLGVNVLPNEIAVPRVHELFEGEGLDMLDEAMKAKLEGLGITLLESLSKSHEGKIGVYA